MVGGLAIPAVKRIFEEKTGPARRRQTMPWDKRDWMRALAIMPLVGLCSCGNMISPSARNSPPKTVTLDPMLAGKALAETTLRATLLSAVKHPVTTVRQGIAVIWNRPRELVVGNLPGEFLEEEPLPIAPGTAEFERLLDAGNFPRPEIGTLKWLVDGKEFFPEFDRQLAAATKSVKMQFYIFDNDDIAVRYADKLRRRSQEVPVEVLYDDFGTASAWLSSPMTKPPEGFEPPGDMKDYMEDGSRVEVRRTLNPWLVADHTKLMLFDGRVAILGGMNMGREYYSEWHDLMVRVEGPVVGTLADIFKREWRKAGPMGDLGLFTKIRDSKDPARVGGGVPIRVLRTESGMGRHEIYDAILLALRGARKRIYIVNPYFASDAIVHAVSGAAKRGVDVRVVMVAEGDSKIMDVGNLATARLLIKSGAKVYRYPRMAHLKVMVCDDWATMGSANLDTLSLRINRELNIAFSDKAEVERLVERVFRPEFAKSRRIRFSGTLKPQADLLEIVADQL